MHQTTTPKRQDRCFTIKLDPLPARANLFGITAQIQQAAMADKRRARRKIKESRKARRWDGEYPN
jgi:hypothetical protein